MTGISHFRCGPMLLIVGLLVVAPVRGLPAQVESANLAGGRSFETPSGDARSAIDSPAVSDTLRTINANGIPEYRSCSFSSGRLKNSCSIRLNHSEFSISEADKAILSVSNMIATDNQVGMVESTLIHSPVRRSAKHQRPATTLIAQRPLAGTSQQEQQNATADIVVLTRRPAEAQSSSSIVRYGITRDDYEKILAAVPSISVAVPIRTVTQRVRYGDREIKASVLGTTMNVVQTDELVVSRGRFLTKRDVENRNNVAVITADGAAQLFKDKDPIGRNVRIKDNYFLIAGVIETQKALRQTSGRSAAPVIYIPITTMNSRFGDQVLSRENGSFQMEAYEVSEIHLAIKNREEIPMAVQKITQLLGAAHETTDYAIDELNK